MPAWDAEAAKAALKEVLQQMEAFIAEKSKAALKVRLIRQQISKSWSVINGLCLKWVKGKPVMVIPCLQFTENRSAMKAAVWEPAEMQVVTIVP